MSLNRYGFYFSAFVFASALFSQSALCIPTRVEFGLKKLSFKADANVQALSVHGEAKRMDAAAVMDGEKVQELEVTVPVEELTTNMSLRDKHMREKIFTTTDGQVPAIRFRSREVTCVQDQCEVKGQLSIRGIEKEHTFPVKVRSNDEKQIVSGGGPVRLSTFGIAQPEQLGVKVDDVVGLEFELERKK